MKQTFFVAGGDSRQAAAAELLHARGYAAAVFGLERGAHLTPETAARMGSADVVLLPLPAADGGFLNAPAMEKKLPMETLWPLLQPRQKIFGGMLSEELLRSAAEYGLRPIDYFKREEFVLRNAYITAEGALELTMDRLPRTIRGTACLVIGYGRIGKFLARLLCALGAEVTVAARQGKDVVQAQLDGCRGCSLAQLAHILPRCGVVYNTVPHLILDRTLLERMDRRCLCIDLASKPGGVDRAAARELGLSAEWALSLPGKLAPASAGEAILETVFQILKEQEVPA